MWRQYLPYIYGGMLGIGILTAYQGLKRLREEGKQHRRAGLWLVNIGVLIAVASFALTIWAK
ncbi:MAG: hypothetical protein AB7G15_11865 [Alphaproteobacteria bacterium]